MIWCRQKSNNGFTLEKFIVFPPRMYGITKLLSWNNKNNKNDLVSRLILKNNYTTINICTNNFVQTDVA